jgi:hypothetical protein
MRGVDLLGVLRQLAERLALVTHPALRGLVGGATGLGFDDHMLRIGDHGFVDLDAPEQLVLGQVLSLRAGR